METIVNRTSHTILQNFLQILPGLSQMLGPDYEVILHDLKYPDSSIIGICGSVTGRTIGGPITNFVLHTIRNYGDNAPNRINYRTETRDGRILRSSTIFIRNDEGIIIGCLCFNSDVASYLNVIEQLQAFTNFSTIVAPMGTNNVEEHFATDITDMMKDAVKKVMNKKAVSPADMHRREKLQIVSELEESGIFDIRGSVEYVATCLEVSTPTIYNYLKEIKKK